MDEKPNVLIVSGYHPKETFAVGVGELLFENIKDPNIKVVRYVGKSDKKNSDRRLRRFIKGFGHASLPVVLHSDDKFGIKLDRRINVVIIYYVRSRLEKKELLKNLFSFISKYNKKSILAIFDIVLIHHAKHNLVEIEFNPEIGLTKAVNFVRDFSRYFLYPNKKIKL